MTPRLALTVPVALLFACAAGCAPQNNTCESPSGAYLVTHTNLGGTCGELPPLVQTYAVGEGPWSSCPGTIQPADGTRCDWTVDVTCVDGAQTLRVNGSLSFETDASAMEGTFTYSLQDAPDAPDCLGTYNVRFVRQ